MRLTKTVYYADFGIYAALVVAVCMAAMCHYSAQGRSLWLLAALVGVLSWTLIEYLLHRFVLHRVPLVAAMHDAHHQVPLAFIGTPTWLSLGIIGVLIFLPAWASGPLVTASGLTAGVMTGFLWYGIIHHAIHYRRPRLMARHLLAASRRHAQHHYARRPGNFGVTTAFWDQVFGTRLHAVVNRESVAEAPTTDGHAGL
jgi:sterol desaturase/sphingolipid hydroxylase (fatty acid hydroxylase superfamily)